MVSINNSILKLQNMKDKNLKFNENFVEERNINVKINCSINLISKTNIKFCTENY